MIRRSALLPALAAVALLPAACSDNRPNPAGPINARSASVTTLSPPEGACPAIGCGKGRRAKRG